MQETQSHQISWSERWCSMSSVRGYIYRDGAVRNAEEGSETTSRFRLSANSSLCLQWYSSGKNAHKVDSGNRLSWFPGFSHLKLHQIDIPGNVDAANTGTNVSKLFGDGAIPRTWSPYNCFGVGAIPRTRSLRTYGELALSNSYPTLRQLHIGTDTVNLAKQIHIAAKQFLHTLQKF